jgi:beta-glucanase (GH16 family)
VKFRVIGGLTATVVAMSGLVSAASPTSAATGTDGATAGATVSAPVATSSYKLVWHDEFKGTGGMPAAWQNMPAVLSSRPCTTTTPAMGKVKNGRAYISVAKDRSRAASAACPHGWLYNAQFSTQSSAQFEYGKFAARIKFSPQSGLHGGFFLNSAPATNSAEVDAVEYFGEQNNGGGLKGAIQNSVYWWKKRSNGSLQTVKEGGRKDIRKYLSHNRTPADNFHTYSVEWTPSQYIFRFDGHVTMRLKRGVAHRPEYLVLSMLSSPFEAKYLHRSKLPATMQVDWVRVWKK